MMFSNKESLNIIETFSNLYVPLDCLNKTMLVSKFQVSLPKSIKLMLRGCNTLTVSLRCVSSTMKEVLNGVLYHTTQFA